MMDCFTFGRKLIETQDLDPVYVLLWNANFDSLKMRKWLLAYWCFYHIGTASWISEGSMLPITTKGSYWERFMTAAQSKDYPRSPERRHFRGQNAIKSTEYLATTGIYHLYKPLLLPREQTCEEVMEKVQSWVGFGPWIAFKVTDMLERLGLTRIAFDTKSVFLFDSPKEGAIRLRQSLKAYIPYGGNPGVTESWAVSTILEKLGDLKAPPRFERTINAQEAETILCKWKSAGNGHYHIGEDIVSCRKAIVKFANCNTAQKLYKAGKTGGLW